MREDVNDFVNDFDVFVDELFGFADDVSGLKLLLVELAVIFEGEDDVLVVVDNVLMRLEDLVEVIL